MKPTAAAVSSSSPDLPPIEPELYRRLEADILERGVILPIVVADGEIIDGRLRKQIADQHGLPVQEIVVGKLSEKEKAEWRNSLNCLRRHLSRQQVRHLIEWTLRQEPESSVRSVAAKIGVSHPHVAKVRREMGAGGNDYRLGADGKRYPSIPKPIVYTNCSAQARDARQILYELGEDAPDGPISPRRLRTLAHEKRREALAQGPIGRQPPDIEILHGSFREIDWTGYVGRCSLILTDPPWLDAWKSQREPLAKLCRDLLRPGGVLAIWTGQYDLPGWMAVLSRHLNYVWTVSAINDSDGSVRAHGRRGLINTAWRPISIWSRGPIDCDRVLFDVIKSPAKCKDNHAWEQPVEEALKLVETYTDPGDWIADPCLGSGSSLMAVQIAGQGRVGVGCDIDPKAVRIAKKRLASLVKQAERA